MQSIVSPRRSWVARLAAITAALTFLLILLGGVVHNTRSSLACPDWPLCYGQVFPKMEGEILVEHSHRLLATLVGLFTCGLVVASVVEARRGGDRRLVRLSIGALALVVVQGVLGGVTVLLRLPTWTSTAHLAVSLAFLCLLLLIVFRARPRRATPSLPLPSSVRRATAIGAGVVYAQILLGALIRHLGAGLACIEVPFCRGLWPTDGNGYLHLHMLHRWMGVVVFLTLLWVTVVVVRHARGAVRALAIALPLLVAAQITLGIFAIATFLEVVLTTAHLGVAAAILVTLVALHLVARGERRVAVDDESRAPASVEGVLA
jgi:heme A synthase